MAEPIGDWQPIPQEISQVPVLRATTETHLHLDRWISRYFDTLGLTGPQFDVLVTLGDLDGLTVKEVGDQSLTTKGSLIPILDRLVAKGLVHRCKGTVDCRQTIVSLTPEGQALYQQAFSGFLAEVRPRLETLTQDEQTELVRLLTKLKSAF
ncbi:MAG: Transcriptional regulator, MarR family [Cyanobacteria bacterium RYN_339]|nr:Transcriptional regulator, MarR family [Cyanobacteria bacterium RYN_339]